MRSCCSRVCSSARAGMPARASRAPLASAEGAHLQALFTNSFARIPGTPSLAGILTLEKERSHGQPWRIPR
ncbi:hypothetical protein ACFPRL_25610 [Pseudoclavibacter helvolus]